MILGMKLKENLFWIFVFLKIELKEMFLDFCNDFRNEIRRNWFWIFLIILKIKENQFLIFIIN